MSKSSRIKFYQPAEMVINTRCATGEIQGYGMLAVAIGNLERYTIDMAKNHATSPLQNIKTGLR
ncbi:MAG: hypothetical protein DHS20C01_00700 [marine bacterium B5-7]|nr:MAG: hypothetical protein DHS20C01_00700 [marine bacterium B5-7]